jgi:hypothetical protein
MLCALTNIAVGVMTYGHLYTACIYRCPSGIYKHYPYTIRVPYNAPCFAYVKIGKDTW